MDFPHPGPGFNPDYRVFNVPKAFDLFHPPPPHFVADPGLAASADTFKASAERPGMRRVAGMGPDFERLQHDAIVHRQVEEATHDHAAHLARASHVHPPLPPGATWHGMAYSPDTHEYVLLAPPSRQQDEQLQQIAALAARRQNAKELHLDPDDVLLQGHSRISHVGHPTDGSHKRLQHVHHTGRRQQQQSEKQPEGGGVGGTSSATPDGGAGAAALSSGPPHPNMRHHHYSHTAPFMRIRIGADEAATLPDPLQPLDPAAITPPPPGLIVSPETAGAASAPPPAVGEDHALLSQVKIAQIDTLGGEVTITAEDVAGAKRPIVFDEETLQPPDAAAVTVSPPPE